MAISNYGRDGMIPPIRVRFQGWESDTYTLQQAGWRVAMEKDIQRMMIHFIFANEDLQLAGMSEQFYLQEFMQDPYRCVIHVNRIGKLNVVRHKHAEPLLSEFEEVDCTPRYSEWVERDIFETGLFPAKRAEDVYVEQADMSVIELLEKIKEKQQPKQDEIRQRIARGEAKQQTVGHVVQIAA